MLPPKFLVCLPFVVLPVSAGAQGWPTPPDAPLRVQVQINLQRAIVPSDGPQAQNKAMEAARAAIYESFKAECGLLSAAFDSNCRLVNINAGSSIMERGNMMPTVNANGNASFELTPRKPTDAK
jgi:hypothetical protein